MHILVAPNAFKNSLTAADAAEAISKGLHESNLSCTTTCFPIGDGGDGTADLLISYLNAETIYTTVRDPLERKIKASFGWVENERTALIELASASGLRLLKPGEFDPLKATTYGTGELIREALNKNATRIILCIGGSATVDGGTGILKALGIKFFDANGDELEHVPASLPALSAIDMASLDKRISDTEVVILCDVENPLLGANGAAAVFGPQKGASETDVELLESRLVNFRNVVLSSVGKDMAILKHGGAAGGVAAALHVFLNARLVNGIEYFLEITQFEKELRKADLVFTGEGRIDEQTLHGKGPFGVAKKAKMFSVPVIGLAGQVPASVDRSLTEYFDHVVAINDSSEDLATAMKNTYANLRKTARDLGNLLNLSPVQNLLHK